MLEASYPDSVLVAWGVTLAPFCLPHQVWINSEEPLLEHRPSLTHWEAMTPDLIKMNELKQY